MLEPEIVIKLNVIRVANQMAVLSNVTVRMKLGLELLEHRIEHMDRLD